MAASSDYRLGSIWIVNFDPSVGTEIRKTRPAVIISGTAFNQRSKVTVLPITSAVPNEHLRPIVLPVIPSTINGLSTESFIVCVDPMTFDKRRLVRCLGELELQQISEVQLILARYLEL
ncbi:type II toxin-antitoxin system PemK/MazF family toxin [Microcoleus sp. S36b_A3]|uniref:type II toxin-antitoxin system PemK/MazF family toxin n=1 Tax=unclassified Microcoleus TaxID=2642155 RepID=UPI002FD47DE0